MSGDVVRAAGAPACDPASPSGCSLCGDEATPARVLAVDAAARMARVTTTDGRVLAAALDLVDDIVAGDVVLVHQGFVIATERAS